ncbi:cytochrome c biogenesis protein ResB [Jonesia denitrificans]|uniref:ResB family protein n=1 Tax=Jonesia denitrificans (strain ATCC 14870 / DSM 20603 / BCRC 15368 / CIP 55.134 / JCM 11481 / NBRC 15587 / NCTC 10816 / Prevot 55134) TaxID=471856 RepID=C7R0N0_JONDD|nr:cytochrome c biogenesis protein ResB [Jonesia denitrificans]ACV08187.1 ResB family protein [Jonesia denitrificans DSM 20603]ASE08140.1 cytochrome c biogenesis protein ResB [Jonesia denitrificans]QXB42744.1 cytochrome c biogenesis protein ResB [Jonesia denitrificans]SQH20168.1 ResB-like family [Jonesia denitrificans]
MANSQSRGQAPIAPELSVGGWLRFLWRQLTSMRVALLLLMLLAVAAIPGSVFPQWDQDAVATAQYVADHPDSAVWLDRLGFFSVYSSPWFSAIYLLLFTSLIGCIIPRVGVYATALRMPPPRVPRVLTRFPGHSVRAWEDVDAAGAATRIAEALRGGRLWRRFRVDSSQGDDGQWLVAAERGYAREAGNLLFHISLVGILVSFGVGQAVEYRGQAIVQVGRGFVNAQVAYDTFESGSLFRDEIMPNFRVTLDDFTSSFRVTDSKAEDFTAFVTVTDSGGQRAERTIKVNAPLNVDGANIYLMGNGHAPVVTVRDAAGEVAFSGAVTFLPEDAQYTSRGVIKVPDVSTGDQLGFNGYLLPTAQFTGDTVRSLYPEALDPYLVLDLYVGDLGLDEGIPQNVYQLSTNRMTPVAGTAAGTPPVILAQGETVDLPQGLGTITFEDTVRYAAFDVRADPMLPWLLVFSVLALVGVALSLFVPRRRVWARVTSDDANGVIVEMAALARGEDQGLTFEIDRAWAIATGATARRQRTREL